MHLIVRASHDRHLATDEKISERLLNTKAADTHVIELPAIDTHDTYFVPCGQI
jgi:hypothetical protein